MTIKIFNPRQKPFGMLSNNAYFPITIQGKKYKTVTQYIYSNLLCEGIYQNLVRNQRNGLQAVNVYKDVLNKCNELSISKALYNIYSYKVKNDTLFKDCLIQTDQKKIIYQSDNKLLGMKAGKGSNLIGKTLEKIRYELLTDDILKQKKEKETQKEEDIYKVYMVVDALDNLMKIDENDLKEFDDMTYNEILNEGNLIDKQYIPKNVIIDNYYKGYLSHKNIIETILKHGNTRQISKLFRKYNIRDLYDNLKNREKNLIFNYYLRDLVLSNYPALPKEKINEAINQQLIKLKLKRFNELRHDINLKYYHNKIIFRNKEVQIELETKLEKIKEKIPTIEQVEDAENFIFDPMYEEQRKNEQNDEEMDKNINENVISPIKQSKQLEMFLENLEEDNDEQIDEIDLLINDNEPDVFENDTEIVFDKNVEGKYKLLSPLYQSWVFLNNLFYPTVTHYLYASQFRDIIRKIDKKKNSWILAHNLITHNNITEDKFKIEKNIDFYVQIDIFNWRQIEKILLCEAKKKMFDIIAEIKFSYTETQKLLSLTKNQEIIYTDKHDNCLGIGELQDGENYTGKWLMKKRKEISNEIVKQAKENEDIILLSQMLNDDKRLNDWIYERLRDLIHTLVLLVDGSNISEENVKFVINKIYFPCNDLEISKIHIESPHSFQKRVQQYLHAYLSEYKLNPKIKISKNAVSHIWKYVSLLSYNLLRQANKAGDMPYVFLSEIQHDVSVSCKIDSMKCIMSAVENLRLIIGNRKLNRSIEKVIGGIIYGKPLRVIKSDQKVLFENKRLSDLCYTLLRKTRQQNGHRVSNRVNFFKSLEPLFIQQEDNIFEDIEKREQQDVDDVLAFLEM